MPQEIAARVEGRDAGRIGWITVSNEEKLNSLTGDMIDGLGEAFLRMSEEDDLRVAVLTGAGDKSFIGGANVQELALLDAETAMPFITRLHNACTAIRDLKVPVIARIQGYCLGAGLEVAASCDMRIAAEGAMFGMPEVRVGIPSVIEAALLPRLVGWGKTAELVMTGEMIDAGEARQCGLVERVTPLAELDASLEGWLSSICASGPHAIRLQKALMREWESLPLGEAVEAGINAFGEAHKTNEPREYAEQFLNRPRSS